jgi:hypothetical protein
MEVFNKLKKQSNSEIELEKAKILEAIKSKGIYEEEGIKIKKWEEGEEKEVFVGDINKNGIKFLGILNKNFQKDGYCLNNYKNNESYFGCYEHDERNRHGLYIYSTTVGKNIKKSQFYWGRWKDNLKDGRGVYLLLIENISIEPFSDFDNSNFDSVVGDFKNDNCIKGVYMSKKGDDYSLYYGGFNENMEKKGDNCFYYKANVEKVIYGKMDKDEFIEGYYGKYDDDGKIIDLKNAQFNEERKLIKSVDMDKINEEEKKKIIDLLENFRNIIMEEDFFGDLYKAFKEIIDYKDKKMKDLHVLDSNEEYPNIMGLCAKYNSIKLFKQLEEHLKI